MLGQDRRRPPPYASQLGHGGKKTLCRSMPVARRWSHGRSLEARGNMSIISVYVLVKKAVAAAEASWGGALEKKRGEKVGKPPPPAASAVAPPHRR